MPFATLRAAPGRLFRRTRPGRRAPRRWPIVGSALRAVVGVAAVCDVAALLIGGQIVYIRSARCILSQRHNWKGKQQ